MAAAGRSVGVAVGVRQQRSRSARPYTAPKTLLIERINGDDESATASIDTDT